MDHDQEDQNYGAELTSVPCRVCEAPVYRTGKRGPVPRIHKGCHDLERAIALLGVRALQPHVDQVGAMLLHAALGHGAGLLQQIAEQLIISPNTVKGHVSNILGKLHLADRTQAAVYAWREGLIRE